MDRWSEAGAIAGSKEPRSRRAAVYQDRPAPPPPDGRAFLCPDPAFPAARAPRGPFHQQQVRSLRRHARPAALAVFAVLALALPAAAQSVTTLVSNAGQSTTSAPTGDADRAQAFTTGAAGATLSSVEIISGDTEGDDMAVSLCTVDSSGYPTSSCTALTAPSSFASGTLVFTDPASTTLAATTTYTLLITSPGGESLRLTNTSSNAEETGAAAGWTIANTYHIKNSANVWGPGGFTTSFLITIKGTLSTTNTAATGAPTITGTAQVGQTLTASTTGIADANGLTTPNYTYQWIRVDGTEADIASANSSTYILVDADLGKTLKVKVTFADDLGHTETLTSAATATVTAVATAPTVSTVDVTSMPASGDTYGTGEMIQFTVTFDQDVTVTGTPEFEFCLGNSDGGSCTDGSPPPTRRRAALSSGSGTTALVFSYTVVAGDMDDDGIWIGDQDRTIKLDTGDAIRGTVGGLDAVLTHPSGGAQTGHKVNGGAAATAPTVNDVAVTSTPASGNTYYLAGEVIEFTVTFSAPVTVTGTPKFAFRLGAATRQAAYASGSDSAALVFARTVQAGEVDRNGISWNALALALDGGTITQTGATTAASLTHAEQAPLEGHRVDAAPPMQVSASVQGMSLVLVYDEPLDPASMPATGAYTVTATVGATTTNPAVSEVSIYGIWVTLTLDAAPAAGATVTLAYAPPASNPVQDEAGNDAPAFSGQSVRLGPPPPPPPDLAQVMGVGVAPGNAQLVVTWTAVDTATGYTVQWTSGSQGYNTGDRQATVTTGSTTRYTIPSLTNGTAYTVRVIATRTGVTDGPPSEEMTGTPAAPPAAPQDLRSEPGDAEVTLRWAAPASDGGSPILRYEYALDDSGIWIDAGGDLEETVRDMTSGQSYAVAVRAVNAAGAGPATTVTSVPADPLPQAWLARFGRTATDHVVDAVSSRWHGWPQASHLTLGGPAEALLGWTGLGGQAARNTAADRGDSVRTEMASPRLLAPSGGAGPGVGGTGPGMTVAVTDRTTAPVGLGGVDRHAGAPLRGRAAGRALLGAWGLPDPTALTDLRAALLGSSFLYAGAQDDDGQTRTPGWLGAWSAWGRGAASWFSGADGGASLEGEVATAMLGVDSRWGRWHAGVVASHSRGQGTYTPPTAPGRGGRQYPDGAAPLRGL